jgi:hypothetical protein
MPSVRHLRSLGGARPPYLRRVARLGHLALGHSGQSPGPAQPGACSCNSASIVIIVCVICSRITSRAVPALSPPLGWADDTDYRTSGPSRASGGSGGWLATANTEILRKNGCRPEPISASSLE